MKKVLLSVFILLTFFLPSCGEEEKDEIKILVTCDGTFDGHYILNSDDPVGFGGGTTGSNPYIISGSLFYYSKTFDDLDNIVVNATRTFDTDTLKIRVYRDDTQVKESFIDDSNTSDFTLELTYNFDEEDDTSS